MNKRTTIGLLTASVIGISTIAAWEGFESNVYKDIVGIETIGYGTTDKKVIEEYRETGISERKARELLIAQTEDIYAKAVRRCITVPLHQHEFDAYISLTYNIGPSAFCNSTLVKVVNTGNYLEGCRQILRWNRAGGRVVQGLVNRRNVEYKLCLGK